MWTVCVALQLQHMDGPKAMTAYRPLADPGGVPLPHSGSWLSQAAHAECGRLCALAAGGSCPAAGQLACRVAALGGVEVRQHTGPACAGMHAGPAALANRQERLLPGAARVPGPGKAARLPSSRALWYASTCLLNMLTEAYTAHLSPVSLRLAGKRVVVICTRSDMWFPHYHWEEMWLKVPTVQVTMGLCAGTASHTSTS